MFTDLKIKERKRTEGKGKGKPQPQSFKPINRTMSNPRRARLERNGAFEAPLGSEETDAILGMETTSSLDEGAVTLAELNHVNDLGKSNTEYRNKESLQMEEANASGAIQKVEDFRVPSSYFSDGKRLIDFVLVYQEIDNGSSRERSKSKEKSMENGPSPYRPSPPRSPQRHAEKRNIFEQNLLELGLELEHASASTIHKNIKFVLIHAPFKVLMRQAELMMVRMPVHRNDVQKEVNLTEGFVNACLRKLTFLDFNAKVKERIEPSNYFCQPFVAQHLDCFVGFEHPETFFTRADRARMVHDLLIRARYDRGDSIDKCRFGVDKLLKNGTYLGAYPLHEELDIRAKRVNYENCSDRQLLFETWVKMKNVFTYQPLGLIKHYFGTKIGFYFAWLGYYTRCLWPVSLLGILFVFYGVSTMDSDIPSNDICDTRRDGISNELICPICKGCDFVPVNSTCDYARITYVFDNWSTIIFAAIMSIWITLFLEGWKRYHAELTYNWNVLGFEPEDEVMRPEFQFRRRKMKRLNPVTKQEEPHIPFMEKAARLCGSGVTVLFFILLVLALLLGIIVYRMIVFQIFIRFINLPNRSTAIWITTGTAAGINLIFILIMNFFYSKLALKLTNWECPRTQSEFDNSYTFKVFLFQFVNFYSSLFYIAFIKGRFAGPPLPDNREHGDQTVSKLVEHCEAAGCMVELVIQLAVIMVGKQIINAFFEIGYPTLSYCFRRWRLKLPETDKQKAERISKEKRKTIKSAKTKISLYEQDFSLNAVSQQFLFDEYLEMVIQLGFVTLFVAAFPLAPLFALINNILEIRLDAYKFVLTTQRPVAQQARNIGIWFTIINMLSNLAVLCNAFVIAFTSDLIPKIYYKYTQESLHGYTEDAFSFLNSTQWEVLNSAVSNRNHTVFCRYLDYRKPPCDLGSYLVGKGKHWSTQEEFDALCGDNYEFQDKWWIILAFRLVFVLVFELSILSIKAIFAYLIPDMPTKIVVQLQRERFLMRQAVLQRRDTPEELLGAALERMEEENKGKMPDRPPLDQQWRGSQDIESIAYQPGQEFGYLDETPRTDIGFDRLTRMFSQRGQPASLSPRGSVGEQEKTSASEPAIIKMRDKSPVSRSRWPTPSMLIVPPRDSPNTTRPKSIEVLQQSPSNQRRGMSENPQKP